MQVSAGHVPARKAPPGRLSHDSSLARSRPKGLKVQAAGFFAIRPGFLIPDAWPPALPGPQAQACTRQATAKPRPDLGKKKLLGFVLAKSLLCSVCEYPAKLDILESVGSQHSGRFLGSRGRLIKGEVWRRRVQTSACKARYLELQIARKHDPLPAGAFGRRGVVPSPSRFREGDDSAANECAIGFATCAALRPKLGPLVSLEEQIVRRLVTDEKGAPRNAHVAGARAWRTRNAVQNLAYLGDAGRDRGAFGAGGGAVGCISEAGAYRPSFARVHLVVMWRRRQADR